MRDRLISWFAAVLLVAIPARADETLVDGIAAQVGGDIVLVSEILQMVGPTEQEMRKAAISEQEIAKLRAEGLERLIEWRLIEQVVRQAELFATDAEVDETIASIAKENGLTIEQLKASVIAQNMRYDDYRAEIRRELERRKVVNMILAPRVRVEEQEVRELYAERFADQPEGGETVHVRQILITGGGDTGRSHKEACMGTYAAYKRIQAGESFQDVARQVSTVAPQVGGDIGWLHSDKLAPWMSENLAKLEPGEISEPLILGFGCTILELVERREYQPVDFEQAKPMLELELREMHLAQEYHDWLEELREQTFIERRGYFADAARLTDKTFPIVDEEPQEAAPP
jgi:peptidyl-prolyl cis-trans isomerase SurA